MSPSNIEVCVRYSIQSSSCCSNGCDFIAVCHFYLRSSIFVVPFIVCVGPKPKYQTINCIGLCIGATYSLIWTKAGDVKCIQEKLYCTLFPLAFNAVYLFLLCAFFPSDALRMACVIIIYSITSTTNVPVESNVCNQHKRTRAHTLRLKYDRANNEWARVDFRRDDDFCVSRPNK